MKTLQKCLTCILLTALLLLSVGRANAQASEQKFQDVLMTAGYATAFGAALGAASLSFFSEPAQHLRLVAIGASLGFIGGSILGSYIVLAPGIGANGKTDDGSLLASGVTPARGLALRPTFDVDQKRISQLEGSFTLFNF